MDLSSGARGGRGCGRGEAGTIGKGGEDGESVLGFAVDGLIVKDGDEGGGRGAGGTLHVEEGKFGIVGVGAMEVGHEVSMLGNG